LIAGAYAFCLWASQDIHGVPPAPVPLEREAPWRIANFAQDAGVLRRMVFDVAFQTNNTAWFAVSDGLRSFDGFQWRHYTAANGLPSSFIRTVTVTRDGSIWVGTDKGAGVFDGTAFDRRGTERKLAGPNVRRIVETSDSSLWFCCDRWPDGTSAGGLTRYKDGAFQTFGLADGLASDHLLNLFEQSNGRLIALTSAGPCVWATNRWVHIEDRGYPTNDHTWTMQETPEGWIFAQGYRATLVMHDGQWSSTRESSQVNNPPVCVTWDGAVIKGLILGPSGTLAFYRWNGEAFVKASSDVPDQRLDVSVLKQAPDGAIWGLGRGTILRWEYQPGLWEWRPDLPEPVLEDSDQRLWFADKDGAAWLDQDQLRLVPEMRRPLLEDSQGGIWAAGPRGVVRWLDGQLQQIDESTCGIRTLLGAVTNTSEIVWLRGRNSKGGLVLAGLRPDGWKIYGPEALGGYQVRSMAADPQDGIWVQLNDEKSPAYEIARVTAEGIRLDTVAGVKPQTHLPLLCASHTRLYLYGYNGLWESPLGKTLHFSQVQTESGSVYAQAMSLGDTTAFVCHESPDGSAAILLRRGQEWLRHSVTYGETLHLNKDGWMTVADGSEFVLWQVHQWNSPTYVSLPTDTTVTSILRSSKAHFWLGTLQGVLHLQPGQVLPDTVVSGPSTLPAGAPLWVKAIGLTPFSPRTRTARHSFSWRMDAGPWSGYGDWPADGISLAGVSAGKHVLEAQARDGMGNADPTPAKFAFEVLPLPVQDQPWFRPALASTGVAFATLAAALMIALRRLRRHTDKLEEQVAARTIELRRDIAVRQQAEVSLRQSEGLLRSIIDSSDSIVWVKDLEGRFVVVNQFFQDLHHVTPEQVLGRTVFDLFPQDLAESYTQNDQKVIQSGKLMKFDEVVKLSSGHRAVFSVKFPLLDANDRIYGLGAICTDITDRQQAADEKHRLQTQLLQAQKMESVGRLAGGVAHDFNNMLQVILGNAALALQDVPTDSTLRDSLEEIEKSAQRSADLTRQLLAFARKQTINPKVLDLNDTVASTLKMLRRLIGEDIQLAWIPGPDLWPVKMDPTQVDQILANLSVNARDAIVGAGVLTIETANVALDSTYAASHPDCVPGDYVMLAVRDNGHGMDEATRAHLFEPFFTTKEVGKGTGLGLATVFGIVKQNHGLISAYSELNRGTTFTIYLPRAQAEALKQPPESGIGSPGGTETVLLVEDEEQILKLGQRILQHHGYVVMIAHTPADALVMAAKHSGHIHLLITDVVMPGLNGKELWNRLRASRPNMKCLFMSGYTADVIAHHGVLEEGMQFLQKPFTIETLTRKLREVLDQPPA
jgi:PAS domain S-box-containing protein